MLAMPFSFTRFEYKQECPDQASSYGSPYRVNISFTLSIINSMWLSNPDIAFTAVHNIPQIPVCRQHTELCLKIKSNETVAGDVL